MQHIAHPRDPCPRPAPWLWAEGVELVVTDQGERGYQRGTAFAAGEVEGATGEDRAHGAYFTARMIAEIASVPTPK